MPTASRTNNRKSVATWSLRLRPVCSFPAAAPIFGSQCRFDEGMDIFVGSGLDLIRSVFGEDLLQTLINGFPFVLT